VSFVKLNAGKNQFLLCHSLPVQDLKEGYI